MVWQASKLVGVVAEKCALRDWLTSVKVLAPRQLVVACIDSRSRYRDCSAVGDVKPKQTLRKVRLQQSSKVYRLTKTSWQDEGLVGALAVLVRLSRTQECAGLPWSEG
jgi:hypothetical protein